jgi:hypothetical protein
LEVIPETVVAFEMVMHPELPSGLQVGREFVGKIYTPFQGLHKLKYSARQMQNNNQDSLNVSLNTSKITDLLNYQSYTGKSHSKDTT